MTAQAGEPNPTEEQRDGEAGKHPLLIWIGLTPGDRVSLRLLGNQDHVGTVESNTNDGLIIWIRDDLNERKLFHFRDCQPVRLLDAATGHEHSGGGTTPTTTCASS